MAKAKNLFICTECDHTETKWVGRCPSCGAWNSFKEEKVPLAGTSQNSIKRQEKAVAVNINDIVEKVQFRLYTGISELDNVLGGGIMKGGAVLLGGEPGIGKSTLMLQMLASAKIDTALYITGEESAAQVKMRAVRLNAVVDSIAILSETDLDDIISVLEETKPQLIVVDSIQTLNSIEVGSVPGTVNQMKYCSMELIDWARQHESAVFLVGHVTKDGIIAGPKVIEHMVDTVLYFDQAASGLRVVRAVKNRFGTVDEIGLFLMNEKGLVPVVEPASYFLSHRNAQSGLASAVGTAYATVYEGSRTFVIEIQALTIPAQRGGGSRIFSERIDSARISRIAAILEKHSGLRLADQDIYINIAGGIKIQEVGMDLPIALAIHSARTGTPLRQNLTSAGELALTGEVRPVSHLDKRRKTSLEMGFSSFLTSSYVLEGSFEGNEADMLQSKNQSMFGCRGVVEAIQTAYESDL